MKQRLFKTGAILVFAALLFSSCEKNDNMKPRGNDLNLIGSAIIQPVCGSELRTTLYAGKTLNAGEVIITKNSNGTLRVIYDAAEGYCFTETHLSVTATAAQVPQTPDKNPKVGLFPYSTTHIPATTNFVYDNIPAGSFIMAHAVVGFVTGYTANIPGLDMVLPATASIVVQYPAPTSYFSTTITNGGVLDGIYEGWCIDTDNFIYPGTTYTVQVISSYNPAAGGLVEYPGNLDLVNWIVNQNFVGKPSTAVPGTNFTSGDVQMAIWQLIENGTGTVGTYNLSRVAEIKAAAIAAGEGFVPDCGGKVAIVLRPVSSTGDPLGVQITVAQVTIINYNYVCVPAYQGTETAWGAGYNFGGNNWAQYFNFCF